MEAIVASNAGHRSSVWSVLAKLSQLERSMFIFFYPKIIFAFHIRVYNIIIPFSSLRCCKDPLCKEMQEHFYRYVSLFPFGEIIKADICFIKLNCIHFTISSLWRLSVWYLCSHSSASLPPFVPWFWSWRNVVYFWWTVLFTHCSKWNVF